MTAIGRHCPPHKGYGPRPPAPSPCSATSPPSTVLNLPPGPWWWLQRPLPQQSATPELPLPTLPPPPTAQTLGAAAPPWDLAPHFPHSYAPHSYAPHPQPLPVSRNSHRDMVTLTLGHGSLWPVKGTRMPEATRLSVPYTPGTLGDSLCPPPPSILSTQPGGTWASPLCASVPRPIPGQDQQDGSQGPQDPPWRQHPWQTRSCSQGPPDTLSSASHRAGTGAPARALVKPATIPAAVAGTTSVARRHLTNQHSLHEAASSLRIMRY